MKIKNGNIVFKSGSAAAVNRRRRRRKSADNLGVPRTGLLFLVEYPSMVDNIGLLITQDQLPEEMRSIFFDGETRRDDADIVARMDASPHLNRNGLMFRSVARGIRAVYGNQLSGRNKLKLYKWMFPYSDDGLELLWGRAQGDVAGTIDWTDGKTAVIQFVPGVASNDASLATPVQVCGPLYMASGALQAKDGTNTASVSTTWAAADVVTAFIEVTDDGLMRVGRAQ